MPPTPETPTFPRKLVASQLPSPPVIVVSPTPSRVSLAQTASVASNTSSKASYAAFYGQYADWADRTSDEGSLAGGMDLDDAAPVCSPSPSAVHSALFSTRLAAHLAREQDKLRCQAAAGVRAC
jgi:hypothetical protein